MAHKMDDNTRQMFENAGLELNENEESLIFSQSHSTVRANLIMMVYSAKLNDRSAKQIDKTTETVAKATVWLAIFTAILASISVYQLY